MANLPRDRGAAHDALISVAQAATLLGVHPNTVRAWTEAGRLVAYRINARGDRRFRQTDVERLLVEGGQLPAGTPPSAPVADDRHERELAVLARLSQAGASDGNASRLCRVVVEALRTELGHDRVAVYLATDEILALETHAGYDVAPPASEPLPPTENAAEEADGPTGEERGLALRLPLRTAQELVGMLVIEDGAGEALDDARIRFLRTLAGALASTLRGVRLLARARREIRRATALRSVTQELTGTLDPAVVLDEVVERTRSLFDADKAGLWFRSDRGPSLELAAHRGLSAAFLADVQRLTASGTTRGQRAMEDRRAHWTRGAAEDRELGKMRLSYRREGISTVCLVPLLGPEEALGLLGLYHSHDRAWPADEVALAQAFANQAAVAIQNARLYRSVADQAARIRSIQDLSARLNSLTDVRSIGDAIVAEARGLAAYHDIRVYVVDWEGGICEPVAYTDRELGEHDFRERLRVAIGPGSFTGTVAASGEPMMINDVLADDRGAQIVGTDEVDESLLLVPMLFEGRSVGVIVLSKLGVNQFVGDDMQTMMIFAGYAAQAFANAAAYEQLSAQSSELARRVDIQRHLLEVSERLLATLDHASVLATIADGLRDVVSYDNLSIYRADPAQEAMVPVLSREQHADVVSRYAIPYGRGLMGWAVEHREAVVANDALADPRALQIPGTPSEPEAVIVVPLIAEGEVLGALNASRIGGAEVQFTPDDVELVKLFAAQASIALRNADTHHAVRQLAETDALTGLGNHGAFQRDLGQMIESADPTGPPAARRLAMLMMDLDRFKAYNDRHGHPSGDALLLAAGVAIRGAAREGDRVYRYGGDEFALILPGATHATAVRVGERIRSAVAALTAADPTPVTITVGVAASPNDAADRATLLRAADRALYVGKQLGEDRVVRADRLPRDPDRGRRRRRRQDGGGLEQPAA